MTALTNNQIMFLLCKVVKHKTSNVRKAQMYTAPILMARKFLTDEQRTACQAICNGPIRVWKSAGILPSGDCNRKDAEHIMASSVMSVKHSVMTVLGFKTTLSGFGVEL